MSHHESILRSPNMANHSNPPCPFLMQFATAKYDRVLKCCLALPHVGELLVKLPPSLCLWDHSSTTLLHFCLQDSWTGELVVQKKLAPVLPVCIMQLRTHAISCASKSARFAAASWSRMEGYVRTATMLPWLTGSID